MEGGQLGPTGVPPAQQVVDAHHHGPGDEHLVEEDDLHGVAQLHRIHLEDGGKGNYASFEVL